MNDLKGKLRKMADNSLAKEENLTASLTMRDAADRIEELEDEIDQIYMDAAGESI